MPRYRTEPHDDQASFAMGDEAARSTLESIETTFSDGDEEIFYCSGYSAREIAQRHRKDSGGTIYVNSVSRKIVRKDYQLASNAPVYYAVAESPIYTLIEQDGQVVRAYWPALDD